MIPGSIWFSGQQIFGLKISLHVLSLKLPSFAKGICIKKKALKLQAVYETVLVLSSTCSRPQVQLEVSNWCLLLSQVFPGLLHMCSLLDPQQYDWVCYDPPALQNFPLNSSAIFLLAQLRLQSQATDFLSAVCYYCVGNVLG